MYLGPSLLVRMIMFGSPSILGTINDNIVHYICGSCKHSLQLQAQHELNWHGIASFFMLTGHTDSRQPNGKMVKCKAIVSTSTCFCLTLNSG